MIGTVLRISWLNLRRDRVALALTFVLPLVFFSVFAHVFSGLDGRGMKRIKLALMVEEPSPITSRLKARLTNSTDIELVAIPETNEVSKPEIVRELVRTGKVDVAVEIHSDFSSSLIARNGETPEVTLVANESNPLAAPLVEGLLQASVLSMAMEAMAPLMGHANEAQSDEALIRIQVDRPLTGKSKKPSVAFFAAGIGVMFLLFSVSGRSAILIEERESGVLTRLLCSRLTLRRLLLGRWLFLTALGFLQVSVMFVWASIAFGLDLWTLRHLVGFTCMTAASAAAAASLGVLLASCCQSRAQLNGLATVLILVMSAVGGSMFPRFLMPEGMRKLGKITFNAWALDGYQKVFWYEAAPSELLLELIVLGLACSVLLVLAIYIARRGLIRKPV
jgi:ABC-2 type transport system permease protein